MSTSTAPNRAIAAPNVAARSRTSTPERRKRRSTSLDGAWASPPMLAIDSAYVRARTAFREVGINWPIVIWIGVVHVLARGGAVLLQLAGAGRRASRWRSSPAASACAWATTGCSRTRAFKPTGPIRWLLALLGGLSGEGSALMWVAKHRKHHAFSDHEGDPHSPKDGAVVEPHALVHAELRPQVAEGAVRALRPRHAQGQDDRRAALPVPAVALRCAPSSCTSWATSVPRAGAWGRTGPAGR